MFVLTNCKTFRLAISAALKTAFLSAWLKYAGTDITAASIDCSPKSAANSLAKSKIIAKSSSGV